jgi:O-antigen/teichoic acid export membrane protein
VNQWALMGFQRFDLFNLYFLLGLVVNASVLVIGLSMGGGLMATAAASVSGQAAVLLLAGRSVRREVAPLAGAAIPTPATWRDLLGFGAMVQASNALAAGQMQAARVLLGALGQLVWVTQFELGFRVTNGIWSLSTLIQYAAYPAAAQAQATGGTVAVRHVYEWCCRWVFLTAAAALGLVWLVAPPLIRLWLGDVHPQTLLTARWLVLAFAFSSLAGPATAVARGIGAASLEVLNYGIALGINLAIGMALVPRLGPEGASIAMAVSFGVAAVALLGVFHPRIGVSSASWVLGLVLPRFVPAAIASLGLGLAFARWHARSRSEAMLVCSIEGLLFAVAFVAMVWPTGDPSSVLEKVKARLRRGPPGETAGAAS